MNTFKLFSVLTLSIMLTLNSSAQSATTESIPVSGNCGMCKSNIEKAAKTAGASEASWDVEKKVLTVKYSSTSTNTAKIQKAVAAAGYDTKDVKAADAAYDKLHACCKYDRVAAAKDLKTCAEKCGHKDGKCDMTACKDKGCCKDEADCKDKGCCDATKSGASVKDAAKSCCSADAEATAASGSNAKSCCSKAH